MKTRELEKWRLDWAVAKALGYIEIGIFNYSSDSDSDCDEIWVISETEAKMGRLDINDWRVTGRMIDQLGVSVEPGIVPNYIAGLERPKLRPDRAAHWYSPAVGPTRQIAVARCFAQAMLGEDVEVPGEAP